MYPVRRIREYLDWCPDHPASSAPEKTGLRSVLLAVVAAAAVILAAALIMPAVHPPQNVAVWAFSVDDTGARHFVTRLPATENADGLITFADAGTDTRSLPSGNYWLVIEHPSRNDAFRFSLGDNYVVSTPLNSPDGGMKMFKVAGPGSLAGEDAYEVLMAAYNGGEYVSGVTTLPAGSGVSEQKYTPGLP